MVSKPLRFSTVLATSAREFASRVVLSRIAWRGQLRHEWVRS